MSKECSYEAYLGGIKEAVARGEIVYHPASLYPYGVEGDIFSHLRQSPTSGARGLVNDANSRGLSVNARMVFRKSLLEKLLSEAETSTYLESGVGLGGAAYDARKIAAALRIKIKMSGISKVPVNPRFALKYNCGEIMKLLWDAGKDPQVSTILNQKMRGNPTGAICLETLLDIQATLGIEFFDLLDEDFMDRQYIGTVSGEFPEEIRDERFDFIHDEYGALSYGASRRKAFELLAEKGVMMLESGHDDNSSFKDIIDKTKGDIVLEIVTATASYVCLVLKGESRMAGRVRWLRPKLANEGYALLDWETDGRILENL